MAQPKPKPIAALSSGLLARKGDARPAMRPQGLGAGEDLGWNDVGGNDDAAVATVPPVLVERAALHGALTSNPPVAVRSVSLAAATRIGRDSARQTRGAKAAFTLRLDSDRHVRLRLASAVTNSSSQALLCQALDAFLLTLPEVDALIAQLPPATPASRV